MSYPIQPYNQNNETSIDNSLFNGNNDGDVFHSFFGMANKMMNEMVRGGSGSNGVSTFMSTDSTNPNVKIFGVSSMNVTQISRGRDGRPHIIQAQDERRMGPGGVWQTKKALRDPDRGIDRMQVGYFVGDRGEIVERTLDPNSGQYRQEIKRRGLPPNQPDFSNQWRTQAQQTMQQPPQLSHQYEQNPQQALPAPPPSYQYY
jgi:hypothetical protein